MNLPSSRETPIRSPPLQSESAASLPGGNRRSGSAASSSDLDDTDIPDLNEASIAVQNIKDMSEEERAVMLRKRNAIYSKRKYYKKKKEVSRLEATKYELESENKRLRNEYRRLETLLLDAKRKVEIMKASSPYAGISPGLLHPYAGQSLGSPLFGMGHAAGLSLAGPGLTHPDPLMQQAYLRSMMLDPAQQARQMELQRALLIQHDRERLLGDMLVGSNNPYMDVGAGGLGLTPQQQQHAETMGMHPGPGMGNRAYNPLPASSADPLRFQREDLPGGGAGGGKSNPRGGGALHPGVYRK